MPIELPNLVEQQVIGFVLIFFRIAGLMLFAPLFGSARIPRRFKVLIALVLTLPMISKGLPASIPFPQSVGLMTLGLGGELVFGMTMGMVVSFVFIAAQWAGEMVGQQIGFNISEVLDPQYGGGGSLVGDLYFMITTVAFLTIGGHLQLVMGIYESFTTCPPLSAYFSPSLLDFLLQYWKAATALALRMAAPMFVTMMIVDVSMGCISKTMPQLNVMSAGMAIRGLVGTLVLALSIASVGQVLGGSLEHHLKGVLEYLGTRPHSL
jgi:flagellar biosynthesis protein FliR